MKRLLMEHLCFSQRMITNKNSSWLVKIPITSKMINDTWCPARKVPRAVLNFPKHQPCSRVFPTLVFIQSRAHNGRVQPQAYWVKKMKHAADAWKLGVRQLFIVVECCGWFVARGSTEVSVGGLIFGSTIKPTRFDKPGDKPAAGFIEMINWHAIGGCLAWYSRAFQA